VNYILLAFDLHEQEKRRLAAQSATAKIAVADCQFRDEYGGRRVRMAKHPKGVTKHVVTLRSGFAQKVPAARYIVDVVRWYSTTYPYVFHFLGKAMTLIFYDYRTQLA
jgi:hypothetical protein